MEITLEKIELVKDRTGASYKDAKDALEAADGNVVDAIIDIEENIDLKQALEPNCVGASLLDTLKGVIRKGNVSKVVVKRDGERLINLPVNAVIIGAALSPLGTIVGISAAFGFKCTIEIVKVDGTIIDVSENAKETVETVIEKGNQVADAAKERASQVKDKASEKFDRASDKFEDAKDVAADKFNQARDVAVEKFNHAKDAASEKISEAREKYEEKKEAMGADIDFSGCFGDDEDEAGSTI